VPVPQERLPACTTVSRTALSTRSSAVRETGRRVALRTRRSAYRSPPAGALTSDSVTRPRLDHRASHRPVWHRGTPQQTQGTRNRTTSARPHPPPYDSTAISIDRVRRKRQRLRSNGSIESDSAVHHPLSAESPARRVTPDRVLPFASRAGEPEQNRRALRVSRERSLRTEPRRPARWSSR
jgi:hypothetical protein